MTLFALIFSILLGAGSLAWGYAQAGLPQFARWIMAFASLWVIAIWQRWRWFAYVGLGCSFLVAALGLWFLDFPPGWMFAGAIGGLLAWDLSDFSYRLRFSADDEERHRVERPHLLRLAFLAMLGFGLASWAMLLKLEFNFAWALVLAVVAVFGVVQVVSWLRRPPA